jgi:hypothetical protein
MVLALARLSLFTASPQTGDALLPPPAEGWRAERLAFPLDFAPELDYLPGPRGPGVRAGRHRRAPRGLRSRDVRRGYRLADAAPRRAGHSFTNPDIDAWGFPGFAYDDAADRRSWLAMQNLLAETFGPAAREQ